MAFFTQNEIAALSASEVRVAFLVQMDFATRTIGVWNGFTSLTVNEVEFLPLCGAGQLDGLEFAAGNQSQAVTVGLSGVDANVLAMALAETPDVQQQLMRVYMQFFDADWQPIAAPATVFWGYMQPPKVTRTEVNLGDSNGAVQSVSVSAENAFFNRSKPVGGRYTDRDQQTRSSGDKFFQFTANLVSRTFTYPDY